MTFRGARLIQRYNAVIGHAPSDDFDDLPF